MDERKIKEQIGKALALIEIAQVGAETLSAQLNTSSSDVSAADRRRVAHGRGA
jgi:hypothetical protein